MAERLSARISVSASQIKDFDRCERAWWLASVARAPDDANAGGQYLLQGDLFDEAVQRFSAKMDLDAPDLVGAVRGKPGLRGAALTTPDEDWSRMAERAQRMLRAVQHHLPPPKTAKVQHRYRVLVPGYEARGGVVITGALDLRRPGEVWDTKSTTDRGPGRGRDAQTEPFALTDATTPGAGNINPLANDVQASLYAWCEFMEDPLRLSVRCTWVYASKPSSGSPQGWAVSHVFLRAETLAWFESYVRPRIDRMLELHENSEHELDQRIARANTDGCLRCFRRLSCNPYSGAQAPVPEGAITMALDLKKLRAEQAARAAGGSAPAPPAPAAPSLESQLSASVRALAEQATNGLADDRRADVVERPALAINRPDAPPNPATPPPVGLVVIETTGVEAPPADPKAGGSVVASIDGAPDAVGATASAAPEPRRGRGRPRKPAVVVAEPAPATATDDIAEQLEAYATVAQGIVDTASQLVAELNAALRARGVRL